jgi:hypothetical protein
LMLAIGLGSCFVFSKAKAFVGGYTQLAEIPALNEKIRDQSAYTPPAHGRLESRQIERYIAVQRGMRDTLGARFQQLDAKYSQLSRDLEKKGREANLRESLAAWQDVMTLLTDAKRAQVDALNAGGFSLGEYQWVRQQTLLALGHGAFGFNLEALGGDPSNMAEALGAAQPPEAPVLQHNRELLVPHEESMEEWLALSFFGL